MAKHRHLGVKILCAILLAGAVCGIMAEQSWKSGLAVMKFDNRTPSRLIWGDRIYDDCGAEVGDRSIGEQIGTIEGLDDSRVFRVKGRPEQDSLIVACSDEMTIYDLYRRETPSGGQGKS